MISHVKYIVQYFTLKNIFWVGGVSYEKGNVQSISCSCHVDNFGGVAHAVDATLDTVYVYGDRDKAIVTVPGEYQNKNAVVGILGVKDTMETPFQQTSLAQKTIDTFAATPSEQSVNVLINVPSIRNSGSTLYNDFSIRGIASNAYQFRINGVPGLLSQTNIPMNMVESATVISGPGIGITGVQAKESAGGVVNLQTKRAGNKDITNWTTYFSGRSTWGNAVDVSRRLDEDKKWGIRINAAYSDGDTGIVHEQETQKNFSINLDHQAERSTTNIFVGYRDTHTDESQRYFDFSAKELTKLPSAPSGKNNYAFDGQKFGMRTWMATLNHVQKLDDTFNVFFNAGYAYNNGYDYLVNGSSRLNVLNNNGDFSRNIVNEPFAIRNGYVQFGLNKKFDIGVVKNDLTFSYDKDWYQARWGKTLDTTGTATGNLYTGVNKPTHIPDVGLKALYSGDSQFYGWTIADTLSYKKLDVTVGAHHHVSRVSSTSAVVKTDATSPLFGIVYKASDNWSAYANHSESFDAGSVIGSSYLNHGQILDPIKTKSNEVGVKYTNGNIITSLSYFDIKQDAKFDEYVDDQNKNLTLNGENRYKGVEWSVSGKVAPKWVVSGGMMYLDAQYNKNNSKYLNGKQIMGTAKWSGVLTAEYDASDTFNAWGRMIYTGSAPIYTGANKELTMDSSTVFDLGVRYKSHIGNTGVDYAFTVFNVFDKDYWLPRPTYSYGILGNPRTYYVSATMHF